MTETPVSILLVDDDQNIVKTLQHILSLSGFTVTTASDGMEAIKKIHNDNFDIVLSDIDMPHMNGLELLTRIRKNYDGHIAFILMTGHDDTQYIVDAIRQGASDFIRKPIDTKQLLRSISTQISRLESTTKVQYLRNQLQYIDMEFVFYPRNFVESDLTAIISAFFQNHFKFEPYFHYELTTCLEEMLYNAFVHGTLQLTEEQRQLDHMNYMNCIRHEAKKPHIASKKIVLAVQLMQHNKVFQMTVSDEGDGFDHVAWLKKSELDMTNNFDYHGRGISLLKLLADDIEFLDGGRTVIVRKKLDKPDHNHSSAH